MNSHDFSDRPDLYGMCSPIIALSNGGLSIVNSESIISIKAARLSKNGTYRLGAPLHGRHVGPAAGEENDDWTF